MNPIDIVVALAMLAGLLQNQVVALSVGALVLVLLWGTASRLSRWLPFRRLEWAIVICLSYWVVNYAWSTGDIFNFFSFEFLRQDGAMLVSYTAFLGLLGWPLKPKQCRAFWIAFLTVLGSLAIPGAFLGLRLPHPAFFESLNVVHLDLTIGEPMFYVWYEAHNTAGGVYALASLIALTLVQEEKFDTKGKIYLWFLLAGCITGLAFTYSRGGYLAFVAGALFILPIKKLGRMIKMGLLIAVPCLLLLTMTSSVIDRVDTITDPYYGTNASRLDIWGVAWEDFTLSPIVGIGYGRFNDERVEFKGAKHIVWVGVNGVIVNNDGHAHNSYLHFLAEGGIIGLALTMNVWWSAWLELSFFASKFPKFKLHWLERAAKACLVGVFAQSLTEHVLGRGSILLVLMTVVGPTLAAARVELAGLLKQTEDKGNPVRVPPVPVAG